MKQEMKTGLALAGALALAAGSAAAQEREQGGHTEGGARPAMQGGPAANARPTMPHGEPHAGPRGYQRPSEPQGWNARPAKVDRGAYQHNFQAARTYRIGPYHRPDGWTEHRWAYGQVLPRAYWGSQYVLADYWLFGLEVPPGGYEWVRDGDDAILVDTSSGEILQVEYGAFA